MNSSSFEQNEFIKVSRLPKKGRHKQKFKNIIKQIDLDILENENDDNDDEYDEFDHIIERIS